jgi:hypothetical protein
MFTGNAFDRSQKFESKLMLGAAHFALPGGAFLNFGEPFFGFFPRSGNPPQAFRDVNTTSQDCLIFINVSFGVSRGSSTYDLTCCNFSGLTGRKIRLASKEWATAVPGFILARVKAYQQ